MPKYRNKYHCADCNTSWEDDDCDSMHNDRCPDCNKEIQPEASEDISEPAQTIQRIARGRYLTPEEAAHYNQIREQTDTELPELIARHHERLGQRMKLQTASQKILLADEIFRIAYDNTNSYETCPELSADLNYLIAAIVQDDYCSWADSVERQLVKILREHCPHDHPVWEYITNGVRSGSPAATVEEDEFAAEKRLAEYWRKKTGLPFSDFDLFAGIDPPAGTNRIRQAAIQDLAEPDRLVENWHKISNFLLRGAPLTRREYAFAIATDLIVGPHLEYEEFFRTRWYENAERRSYGRPE